MTKQGLQQNCRIILASTSRIRQQILQECGIEFEIMAPLFDEDKAKKNLSSLNFKEKALFLAKSKAMSISEKFPNQYVIGSDQICEVDGIEIEKSKDLVDACKQLHILNGKTHYQNNAVVIYRDSELVFKSFSKAELQMRTLTKKEIQTYVTLDQSFGCAGSYKFESFGKHLFKSISADYYSILGLNVLPILNYFFQNKLIKFS